MLLFALSKRRGQVSSPLYMYVVSVLNPSVKCVDSALYFRVIVGEEGRRIVVDIHTVTLIRHGTQLFRVPATFIPCNLIRGWMESRIVLDTVVKRTFHFPPGIWTSVVYPEASKFAGVSWLIYMTRLHKTTVFQYNTFWKYYLYLNHLWKYRPNMWIFVKHKMPLFRIFPIDRPLFWSV